MDRCSCVDKLKELDCYGYQVICQDSIQYNSNAYHNFARFVGYSKSSPCVGSQKCRADIITEFEIVKALCFMEMIIVSSRIIIFKIHTCLIMLLSTH